MRLRRTLAIAIGLALAGSRLWGVPEEREGLLLGLRAAESYRTLWLTTSAGALSLEQEIEGILFPRGSRLCRLVIRSVRTVDPTSDTQESYNHVGLAVDCGETPLPEPKPEPAPGCSGGGELEILFAGPAVLSQRYVESSVCNFHTNYYQALTVFSTGSVVGQWSFDALSVISMEELGPGAAERLRRAAVDACKKLSEEDRSFLDIEDCAEVQGAEQWAISRDRGRWSVLGLTPGLRANDLLYVVPLDLPKSMVPANGLALPWEAVVRSVPDAEDAVTSPEGSLAVVMTPTAILRANAREGELELVEAVAPKQAGEVVTAVEWAAGPEVERWSEELKKRSRPAR